MYYLNNKNKIKMIYTGCRSNMGKICEIVIVVISVILLVWGFQAIMQEKPKSWEDGTMMINQIRGFGYLLFSQIIIVAGLFACESIFS